MQAEGPFAGGKPQGRAWQARLASRRGSADMPEERHASSKVSLLTSRQAG